MRPVRIRVERAGQVAERDFTSSPIQIGRSPKADLSLPFDTVSTWHAVIRFDDREATFFDLGSTNGTEYEGRRIGPGQEVGFDTQPVRLIVGEIALTLWREEPTGAASVTAGTFVADPAQQAPPRPTLEVEAMLGRLRPYFEQFDAVRQRYEEALVRELTALPDSERETASDWVSKYYPPSPGVTRHGGGGGGGIGVGEQLVPFAAPPQTADDARDLVRRVSEMMTVCAKGLVQLQEGQESIGKEFGVKAVKHYSGLRFAMSADEALAYLFNDPDPEEHTRRLDELSAAFSDTMSHQIATINGVVSGARALLDEFDPGSIERDADPGRLTRFRDCWNTFLTRWERLSSDGPMITVLFGPEFARVYAEVGGELADAWQRSRQAQGQPAGLVQQGQQGQQPAGQGQQGQSPGLVQGPAQGQGQTPMPARSGHTQPQMQKLAGLRPGGNHDVQDG